MSSTQAPQTSLYVGNLHPDVNEHVLYDLFKEAAQITSIYICRNSIDNTSLGYAYVNLATAQDAKKIIDQFNFVYIQERQIRIMWANRDPGLRKSGIGNIFVKNLPKDIDSKVLQDVFSRFGNILSCYVSTRTDENSRESVSNGFGFVHFEDPAAAEAAIAGLNNKYLNDHLLSVAPFKSKSERPSRSKDETFTNVYIKNLATSTDDEGLKKIFEAYGEIQNAAIMRDSEGKSKGFGFVNFVKHEDAKRAVDDLNGKNAGDEEDKEKTYFVSRAQSKDERSKLLKQEAQTRTTQKQETNLYVRHFPDDCDEAKLREMFAEFGEIKSVRVMRDQKKKTSRGFGFVCFSNAEDASNAISAMHGKMLSNQKPLFVTLHQPKAERKNQIDRLKREHTNIPMMNSHNPMMYGIHPYMQPMGYPHPPAGLLWGQPQMGPMITPEEKKQQIGNQLYGLVHVIDAENAAKITGMFLELDEAEITELLTDNEKLQARVQEAIHVLNSAS